MKTQTLAATFVLLVCLAGTGCKTGDIKSLTHSLVPGETKVYPQNQEVTLVEPFSVKIERCFWADEFGKPGYESMPAPMRDQFLAKPNGKFLVVEVSITNLGNKPAQWKSDAPPLFLLRNAQGTEYAAVRQDINAEDITSRVALAQVGSLNPRMTCRGSKVFDVPKDDYLLVVSTASSAGTLSFMKSPTTWVWGLSPAPAASN